MNILFECLVGIQSLGLLMINLKKCTNGILIKSRIKIFIDDVQLYAMSLQEDETAKTLYLSTFSHPKKIYTNVYDNHLNYITDVNMYLHRYVCTRCDRLFNQMQKLKQHQPKCDGSVKYMYPGGVYKNKPSIVKELEQIGVRVNEEDKCEKWYACYDFKAYQRNFDVNVDDDQVMEKGTTWNNVHVPVSFSVGSNLDGAETFHVSDKDLAHLVSKLVGKLLEIAVLKYDASKARFRHIFHQLDEMREAELEWLNEVTQDLQAQGVDLEELMNDNVEIAEESSITSEQLKVLEKLYGKSEGYRQELGAFGFNSAGYDVKLIKQYLFKELCEHGEQPKKCLFN